MQRRLPLIFTAALICLLLLSRPAFASGISLRVEYDALRLGEPVTFTLTAEGATEPLSAGGPYYKYLPGGVTLVENGTETAVTDPAQQLYQTENTFSFTFLCSGTYKLRFYAMGKSGGTLETPHEDLEITLEDPDHPPVKTLAERIAGECLKTCSGDYEKALWLHDWLTDHCSYDRSLTYCSAEAALARGCATCEGFHRAYVMLLDEAGIKSGRMTGNGHVWTAVMMENEWYQVDVTWDAGNDRPHLYFGLTDAVMQQIHPDHKPRAGYESDSYACNYHVRSGDARTFGASLEAEILENLAGGAESFSLDPDPANTMTDNEKAVLLDAAAFDLSGRVLDAGDRLAALKVRCEDGVLLCSASFEMKETAAPETTAEPPETLPPETAAPFSSAAREDGADGLGMPLRLVLWGLSGAALLGILILFLTRSKER